MMPLGEIVEHTFAECLAAGLDPEASALSELTAIGRRFGVPSEVLWAAFDCLPDERRAQAWADVQEHADYWHITPSERDRPEPRTPAPKANPVRVRSIRDYGDDPLRRISVAEALESLTGRQVDGRGWASCPFHGDGQERTPSFHATDDRWYCFGCGHGGTIIDLGAELYRLEARGSGFHEIRSRLAADLLATLDDERGAA